MTSLASSQFWTMRNSKSSCRPTLPHNPPIQVFLAFTPKISCIYKSQLTSNFAHLTELALGTSLTAMNCSDRGLQACREEQASHLVVVENRNITSYLEQLKLFQCYKDVSQYLIINSIHGFWGWGHPALSVWSELEGRAGWGRQVALPRSAASSQWPSRNTLSTQAAAVSICFFSQAGQQHFQRHCALVDRGGGLCETKVGLDRPQHLRLGQEEGGACNGSSQMWEISAELWNVNVPRVL